MSATLVIAVALSLDALVGVWKVKLFAPVSLKERSYSVVLEHPQVPQESLFGWNHREDVVASLGPVPTRLKGRRWPLVMFTRSDRMGFCHRFVGRVSRRGMKGWVALFEPTCEQRRLRRYFRWQARREEGVRSSLAPG